MVDVTPPSNPTCEYILKQVGDDVGAGIRDHILGGDGFIDHNTARRGSREGREGTGSGTGSITYSPGG